MAMSNVVHVARIMTSMVSIPYRRSAITLVKTVGMVDKILPPHLYVDSHA